LLTFSDRNLETVRRIADTGVDFISVGAITHSAPAADIGLDVTFARSRDSKIRR
jgi:nicotinate-nucleotide pyrophosphorylase (carboxylating)